MRKVAIDIYPTGYVRVAVTFYLVVLVGGGRLIKLVTELQHINSGFTYKRWPDGSSLSAGRCTRGETSRCLYTRRSMLSTSARCTRLLCNDLGELRDNRRVSP